MIPKLPEYSMKLLNPPADEESEDSEDEVEDENDLANASFHSQETDLNDEEKTDE